MNHFGFSSKLKHVKILIAGTIHDKSTIQYNNANKSIQQVNQIFSFCSNC